MRIEHVNLINWMLFVCSLLVLSTCNESNGKTTPDVVDRFSPITSFPITNPHPVLGSDGRYHLVYELQMTNSTGLTWIINSFEILDGNSDTFFPHLQGMKLMKDWNCSGQELQQTHWNRDNLL